MDNPRLALRIYRSVCVLGVMSSDGDFCIRTLFRLSPGNHRPILLAANAIGCCAPVGLARTRMARRLIFD